LAESQTGRKDDEVPPPPPYIRDISALKLMFVTQVQHQEFSDQLYKHISAGQHELMDKLDGNRSAFIGETQGIHVEISNMQTEIKSLAKRVSEPWSIAKKIAATIGGIVFLITNIILILSAFHLIP